MTREEAKEFIAQSVKSDVDMALVADAIEALDQEPCEDTISRKSIKQKLQEHHDFFVNAYGGFSNLPLNDKSRVDEITNCIAMVVNEPSVTPRKPQTFKWCTSCREYDPKKHCCSRWSKVIRDTVEEMKQEYIDREVLDKLRAEVENINVWGMRYNPDTDKDRKPQIVQKVKEHVIEIIDNYKAEQEE